MKLRAFDISEANSYIKRILTNDPILYNLRVKGEISNFKAHTRGHYYFTIKDEFSRINAIMFATNVKKLKFLPQDGMKVMLTGRISVYEASGTYQIYVNDMIEDGIDGILASDTEWEEKLEALIINKAYRSQIAENAYRTIMSRATTKAIKMNFLEIKG